MIGVYRIAWASLMFPMYTEQKCLVFHVSFSLVKNVFGQITFKSR